MVTKYEMRVAVSCPWPRPCICGAENVTSVVEDVGDGPVEEDGDGLVDADVPGAAPIIAFSLIMHPSPTEIGPSKA
jgi:hypothetical protein